MTFESQLGAVVGYDHLWFAAIEFFNQKITDVGSGGICST